MTITCEHCRHFQPDPINPAAGMGRCLHTARHGMYYPNEKHPCRDFSEQAKTNNNERGNHAADE